MPVLGRERLLEEALYSLLLQTHQDWELVIKDGDLERPARLDKRIEKILDLVGVRLRYEVGLDGGIFHAFNEAFALATGDVLYAMCSDDLLCPGALSSVSAEFEQERYPTVFWIYGKTVSADQTGRKLGVDGMCASFNQMLVHNRIGLPSVFWSRGLYGLEGGFDTRYRCSADYDMYLRFWRRREPSFLNQELGVFRHHGGNWSQRHVEEVEVETQHIRERHKELGEMVTSARNVLTCRRAYGGEQQPETVN